MKEENKKIDKLSWEEIINSVGKPVYDKKSKKWRVIDGYERLRDDFFVKFTDSSDFKYFYVLKLYLKEID